MRGPLIATGVVLVGGALIGLRQESEIRSLHQELDRLQADARKHGIELAMSTSAARRGRVSTDRKAANLATEMSELLSHAQAIERAGGKPDEALKNQIIDLTVKMMELSPENMRKVLAGLRADESISEETKSRVIGFSILFISGDHPQEALRLMQESKDLLSKGTLTSHVVSSALQSWAKLDPAAAVQWVKGNPEPPAGVSRDDLVHSVLAGAAEVDVGTAFRLLDPLGMKDSAQAAEAIAASVPNTAQGRESLLKAMREHLARVDDPAKAGEISSVIMESVAHGLGKNSFGEVSSWLDGSGLESRQLAAFAGGLSWFSTGKETGQWLDWMGGKLSGSDLSEPVQGLMSDWVQEDYLAAGQWLSKAADGPVKIPAVMAYAESVAPYDPEVAAQWALTLQDPVARMETLRAVHNNWPENDKAGAARFAARHGLEE